MHSKIKMKPAIPFCASDKKDKTKDSWMLVGLWHGLQPRKLTSVVLFNPCSSHAR